MTQMTVPTHLSKHYIAFKVGGTVNDLQGTHVSLTHVKQDSDVMRMGIKV